MKCTRFDYDSGAVCLFTGEQGTREIGDAMAEACADCDAVFGLVFFSKSCCSAKDVIALMKKHAPGLAYAGCSTAGEVTPDGVTEGQMLILLLPRAYFRIAAMELHFETGETLDVTSARVAAFRRDFVEGGTDNPDATRFAICMTDGMAFNEEAVAATLHWGLDDMPLLGGSAGDGLDFRSTSLILNGEHTESGTILLLFECLLPTQIFKTENFVPTNQKLVVTKSDPAKRIVYEFNAANAAETYAEVIGVDPKSLSPMTFASHPVVMRVGNEFYCRSIQKVNEDNSLSFFCAIDDGVVLTVAEPTGMARSTAATLEEIRNNIGNIDFVLGFDCVLRRVDARNRQVTHRISNIYRENRLIGFNTYGEQYRSMHLNQTLTGVAFGTPLTKSGANP